MFRITYTVQGIPIRIELPDTNVFVPNLVTPLSASQFRIRPGETVCDLSTGCGFHAIVLAKLGAKRAYGIDINADAIRAAKRNARLNGVADRCVFLRGSMFDPLEDEKKKLDFIVSTLPNAPAKGPLMKSKVMRAFPRISRYLGAEGDGAEPNVQFVRHAGRFLSPSGRIQLHLVDWSNAKPIMKAFKAQNYHVRRLAKAYIPWWGRRCNIRTWMRWYPDGGSMSFDFNQLPYRPGSTVKILAAAKNSRRLAWPQQPAEAELEWGKVPMAWRKG